MGAGSSSAQVPHPEHGGFVTGAFQGLGEGSRFAGKFGGALGGNDFVMGQAGFVPGVHHGENPMPGCVLSGHEAGPSRRTIGGAGVGLLENYTLPGQAVRMWGFDKFIARETHVLPAHVIDEDQYEVGLERKSRVGGWDASRQVVWLRGSQGLGGS